MKLTFKDYEDFFKMILKKDKVYLHTDFDPILSAENEEDMKQGVVYYTLEIDNILKTKAFKRIDRIFQLGTKIYSSNRFMHTRGEHSKGTYQRTLDLLVNLCKKEEIMGLIKEKHYEKFLFAELVRALLHDIGHGPFSHTTETVCTWPKGFHEQLGKRIINEDKELNSTLNGIYLDLTDLIDEVEKKNFLGLNSLFEGQFDVDRADFLPRDNYASTRESMDISTLVTELFDSVEIRKVEGKNKLLPVFPERMIKHIERFLECRYNNYQLLYYSNEEKLYEHIFKEFAIELLNSSEDFKLKTYLAGNVNKKAEEIDLEEYMKYNDIEYFKGILEVYKKTENERLKELASYCLPNKTMIRAIYSGLLSSGEKTNEYGYVEVSEDDMRFLKEVNTINQEDSQNLVKQNFLIQRCNSSDELNYKLEIIKNKLKLDSIEQLSQIGILYDISKNELYKNKPGEEIYIQGDDGEIYTFDEHPKREIELKKFENNIIIIDKKQLLRTVKNKNEIMEIVGIVEREDEDSRIFS